MLKAIQEPNSQLEAINVINEYKVHTIEVQDYEVQGDLKKFKDFSTKNLTKSQTLVTNIKTIQHMFIILVYNRVILKSETVPQAIGTGQLQPVMLLSSFSDMALHQSQINSK